MSYFVRFESKEDLELLTRLVENTIERLKTTPSTFADIAEPMFRVVDSLHSAAPLKDAHFLDIPKDIIDKDKKAEAEAKAAKPKNQIKKMNLGLCDIHRTYGAKQVPRTDCDGCWSAYKKFNPTKYTNARRSFDRKQARSK